VDESERPEQQPDPAGRLADALAPLAGLAERPIEQHPDVFQEIHSTLQGALADIDGS
jgi:hypothetical protein